MSASKLAGRLLNLEKNANLARFAFAIGLLAFAQSAHGGTILGTASFFGGIETVSPNSASNLSALIAIGPPLANCFVVGTCPKIALLEGIDSSATGTTVILGPASPDFAGVAGTLTNGLLDLIQTGVVPGPSYGTTSGGSIGFFESIFGTSPDFAGKTIGSIALHIDGVTIGPGSLGPGNAFRLDYTLTVSGPEATPEPASWLTLAVGGFAIIALSRKRGSLTGRPIARQTIDGRR